MEAEGLLQVLQLLGRQQEHGIVADARTTLEGLVAKLRDRKLASRGRTDVPALRLSDQLVSAFYFDDTHSLAHEDSGTVRLAVKPWGEVFVDGASRGVSPPLKRLSLAEGTYQVEIRNPAGPSLCRRIVIKTDQSVAIDHQF